MREPQVHSHITGKLPDSHPLANDEYVTCAACNAVLHAVANECMQTWIETGEGNYCLRCFNEWAFDTAGASVLEDRWGLPDEADHN